MEDLEMPELVWKRYLDLEIDEENWDEARALFERLLEKTNHARVYIAYAQFEAKVDVEKMREVLDKGEKVFKLSDDKESRAMLLDAARSTSRRCARCWTRARRSSSSAT